MNAFNVNEHMQALGLQAKTAAFLMARADAASKNKALKALARRLREAGPVLSVANQKDLERATAAGLSAPMVDRLKLTPKVIETVAQGCEQLAGMADVIGEIIGMKQQPSGIRVGQMRVPIGVFGMIYESRPNVTIEAASLAIKSGNAAILRGGSEAIESNKALALLVSEALAEAGLPIEAVQLVQTTDREAVGQLIAMPEFVDVIIPRGGKGLIQRISRDAKVPVIKHLDGNCHVYVDDSAEFDMALRIVDNAKTQKYSPCNAAEGLLVSAAVAEDFLPRSPPSSRPRVWKCAAIRRRRPSCVPMRRSTRRPRWSTRSSRTGRRNTLPRSSASRWWPAWTRPSPTSTATRATTLTPSSRATTCTRSASCARSIRPV